MKDLTIGNETKLIFYFALPMLIGNIFQQLYNVADSIIVGNYLGKEALSAVGASFPIIFVLISLVMGISMGCSIIISQYYGAKNFEKLKIAIDTMFIVVFIGAILTTILGILITKPILVLTKLPANIIPQAVIFLQIQFTGMIFMFGYHAIAAILRGLGDSKTPLYFLIVSTILNIILVLLFVVKFKMGIAGASLATVTAQGVAFISSLIYLQKYTDKIKFSITKIKFDKEIFYKSVKIGLPSGFQQMLVALGMITLFSIVNKFGTDTIAAYSVAGRIDSFAIMPAMNFSMALSSFVGQNIGANKTERVRKGLISTVIMTGIVSILFSLLAIFFSKNLMGMFTNDYQVILIGSRYLVIVSLFYIAFSCMFSFTAVFRGAGDTLIPMFITILSLWLIRVPLAYFLSGKFGETGIWWSIPIAWIAGTVFSYFYYISGKWKNKSVVVPQKAI